MRKILLATTALAMALPALSTSVEAVSLKGAKTPALRMSGQSTFNYFAFNQTVREPNRGKGGGHHMAVEDARINFEVFGKADGLGGLEYSFLIGLSGDTNLDKSVEENRLKFKGEWGTLLLGNARGVDDFMAVGAYDVMGGTGGFAGNYTHVTNPSNGVITTVDLQGAPKDSTKVTYVTPRVNGFQAGLSFTPHTQHKGEAKLFSHTHTASPTQPFDKNQVGLGLNYKETFGNGVDVKLSGTLLYAGKTMRGAREGSSAAAALQAPRARTKSYALGTVLGWKDWKLGGEFIDNGHSQVRQGVNGRDAGKAYSLALGYDYGVDSFAFGWYGSSRNLQSNSLKAKANVWSLTWDRKLAPGLSVYAEGNFFDYKTDTNLRNEIISANNKFEATEVDNNRGHVIIVGSKIKF